MIHSRFSTVLAGALLAFAGSARGNYIVITSAEDYFGGNGWQNNAAYNVNSTGPFFYAPQGGITTGTTDPTGTATSAFDQTSLSDSDSGASAFAYADLSTGKLGVMGTAGGNSAEGLAYAQYSDVLHYTIAGANASTITNVGITFAVDGSMVDSTSSNQQSATGQLQAILEFGNTQTRIFIGDHLSGNTCPNGPCVYNETAAGDWINPVFAPSAADLVVFNATLALTGASGDIPVLAVLSLTSAADGGGSAVDDYSHTGALSLNLPQGVSFTSDSGVFLSAATPEPATLPLAALSLAAMGMLGFALKRRARN